jgi:hypothetical protein
VDRNLKKKNGHHYSKESIGHILYFEVNPAVFASRPISATYATEGPRVQENAAGSPSCKVLSF